MYITSVIYSNKFFRHQMSFYCVLTYCRQMDIATVLLIAIFTPRFGNSRPFGMTIIKFSCSISFIPNLLQLVLHLGLFLLQDSFGGFNARDQLHGVDCHLQERMFQQLLGCPPLFSINL